MSAALAFSAPAAHVSDDETLQRSFRFPAPLVDELAALQKWVEHQPGQRFQRHTTTSTVIWALTQAILAEKKKATDAGFDWDAAVDDARRKRTDED